MEDEIKSKIDLQVLPRFIGSERFYSHPMYNDYFFTQGVHYLFKNGAAWLVEDIFSYQDRPKIRAYKKIHWIQVWTLAVGKDRSANLTCIDANERDLLIENYKYTDFPLPGVKLFLCHNVLMLPTEY